VVGGWRKRTIGTPPASTERVEVLHIWFWAWLVIAAVCALYELYAGEMLSLPWALGALSAAVLEFLGVPLAWQWVAFFAVSFVFLVAMRRWWLANAEADSSLRSEPDGT